VSTSNKPLTLRELDSGEYTSIDVACEHCGYKQRCSDGNPTQAGTRKRKCDDCGKMFDVSHYWSRRRAFLAAEHERGYDPQRLAAMLSQVTLTEPDLDDVADEEWPVSPVSQPGRRQWPVPVVVAAAVGGLSTVGLVILLVLLATGVIV